MKLHLHVGVIECVDEATLEQALAVAGVEARVLARPAPNVAVLEQDDADELLRVLEDKGLHPKVMR
jgi:hypothetical protein